MTFYRMFIRRSNNFLPEALHQCLDSLQRIRRWHCNLLLSESAPHLTSCYPNHERTLSVFFVVVMSNLPLFQKFQPLSVPLRRLSLSSFLACFIRSYPSSRTILASVTKDPSTLKCLRRSYAWRNARSPPRS